MINRDIIKYLHKKQSKIEYTTLSNSVSYYGHPLDILKSAVQKYLRRREFDKMIWVVAEIYIFTIFPAQNSKFLVKSIITNLINRIIIMLDEELLFSECEKYLLIREYIDDFENSERLDFSCLYKICKIMTKAKMIRRNEDIKAFWDIEKNNKLFNKISKKYNIENMDDTSYFNSFKECFEKKDDECFMWMFLIFNGEKQGTELRYKSKENIYMVWKYLLSRKNIKENKVLRKCLLYKLHEFKKKNRHERFIFITASIDIALHIDLQERQGWFYDCAKKNTISTLKKKYDKQFDKDIIYEIVFKDRQNMAIDDYAIDMHTLRGRQNGKNKKDFITTGSYVINEDKKYYNEEWRKVYNSLF